MFIKLLLILIFHIWKHNLTKLIRLIFFSTIYCFLFIFSLRLVSGAGDIKITKDGNVLLHEMQIQHPTASLIARASTAQDDMTGDGTTSTVLVIGELLKQADIYIAEGLHPRILTEGFDKARVKALEVLENMKIPVAINKESLTDVCRTSLRTKVRRCITKN